MTGGSRGASDVIGVGADRHADGLIVVRTALSADRVETAERHEDLAVSRLTLPPQGEAVR